MPVNRPRTREQEKVLGQFLQNVATCIDAEKRMAEMTDAELADVLDVQLGQTDIDSVLFEVLDQAIKRLRRSGGGPVPTECGDESTPSPASGSAGGTQDEKER